MLKKIKKILSYIGPGFITGAADDDPSGIVTYTITGALFGFKQLWLTLFSWPFMTTIQEMSGRISMVTGKGLARIIKEHYPRSILYGAVSILFFVNVINIATDLGAMAAAFNLILPRMPFSFWLLTITGGTLALEIFVSYKFYARYLKYLAFTLIFYIFSAFLIKINVHEVIRNTTIPFFSFSKEYIMNIVAFLGTTISPYLFFWQSYEEVEDEISLKMISAMGQTPKSISPHRVRKLGIDTAIGMFFSNAISWFIIVAAGSTLVGISMSNIGTAADAARALEPFAGHFATILFSLAIISTGLLAVPVLATSVAYALADIFNFKAGLYKKFRQAHGFYGAITLAVLVGLIINFIGIDPIKMLYYTAILNGIAAPPLIFLIIHIANKKKLLGRYRNDIITNTSAIILGVVMSVSAIILLFSNILWK